MKLKLLNLVGGLAFLTLAGLLFFSACRKQQVPDTVNQPMPDKYNASERALLKAFIESSEFSRVSEQYLGNRYGKLNLANSSIEYVDDNPEKPLLNLRFMKGNKVAAALEVVPLPVQLLNVLPENEHYVMMLHDYSAFDAGSGTGRISCIDLNYDGFVAVEAIVREGRAERVTPAHWPSSLKTKYAYLKKKNELTNGRASLPGASLNKVVPCDLDGNNNLSFSECYSCLSDACSGDPDCKFMCTLINVASSLTSVKAACTMSTLAACVYLSIVY